MATIGTLTVKLVGDISEFQKNMDSAGQKVQNVGKNITSAGKTLTTRATLPLAVLGAVAVNSASDLEESLNKVNVVFGDQAGAIVDYTSTAADSMGMTQQQALEAVGTYGALFDAMEVGPDVSADMSQSLVTLAADLASFNNMDPTEVLTKLRAGLTGETEPLKTLGVNLNQATIEMKAFELGLVEAEINEGKLIDTQLKLQDASQNYKDVLAEFGPEAVETQQAQADLMLSSEAYKKALEGSIPPLTAAQKAQASYALIMEQTEVAQGDFQATSDGLANSTRILKANIGDMAAEIGTMLLPYVQKGVIFIQQLMDRFNQLSPSVKIGIVIVLALVAALGPLLMVVGMVISGLGAVIGVLGAITAPVLIVIAIIAALAATAFLLYTAWKNNWGGIQEKTQAVVGFISGIISGFLSAIRGWWDEHGAQVMAVVQALWDGIQKAIEFVLDIVSTIFAAWSAAFSGDWETFGEKIREAWDKIWELIVTALELAWEAIVLIVGELVDTIIEFFTETDWLQIGKDIMAGIASGIEKGVQWAIDAIIAAAQAIWDALTGFFGTGSPSKLMMTLGHDVTKGWAVGIEQGGNMPVYAAANIARPVAGSMVKNHNLTIFTNAPVERIKDDFGVMETWG